MEPSEVLLGITYSVLAVEPRGLHGGDEELGALGVGPGVRHGQIAGGLVLDLEVLVIELATIDGLASDTSAVGEVSSLNHNMVT